MSYDNPRCKAFCRKIDQFLWEMIAVVIFCMWAFYIYQMATS